MPPEAFTKLSRSKTKYILLANDISSVGDSSIERGSSLSNDCTTDSQILPSKTPGPSRACIILSTILILSLLGNLLLIRIVISSYEILYSCPSRYSGLTYNHEQKYATVETGNESQIDDYWKSLDTSPVIVALDHESSDSLGLARSAPFIWDNSKGVYHIKAFHQLHCLKVIRESFQDPKLFTNLEAIKGHVFHCLHTLRQDLMCKADDTLMPTEDLPHVIGDNQILKCRNWDELVAWAQAPERNACYRIVSDYRTVANTLEQYAFCPENSPYYETSRRYFEKWGHKPMFTNEEGAVY